MTGIEIFWQIITKSYERYPQATKEKLSKRFIDLLSGGLDTRNIDDPVKYLDLIAGEFIRISSCHLLQFLRKYIELFPYTTE